MDPYDFVISQRPDYALVSLKLKQGQQIFVEPSAMATMSPNLHLKAGFKGGFKRTLGRAFGGESMIINTFTAQDGPATLDLAAGQPGDAEHYRLDGNTLYLQRGAYLANGPGVEVSGKWQGAKGFFSGEGLVLLKASGTGDLFFTSYGALMPIDVDGEYIVDTGYIAAFEDTLQYRVSMLPGRSLGSKFKAFFFGGEGFVCRFSGKGKVWIQTRAVHPFLNFVQPYRPARNSG